jgi:hypothetical protein
MGERLAKSAIDFQLSQGQDIKDIHPTRQRLPCLRQRRIPCRARENVSARAQIAVELGLYRVEKLRNMLILVDQHRAGPGNETPRVVLDGRARRWIVTVDHYPAKALRKSTQQGTLPDRSRPGENHRRFLTQAV